MASVTVESGDLPSMRGKDENGRWNVILKWKSLAQSKFRNDCLDLLQMIDETDELELWKEKWGGFSYKDRDDFLQNCVLIDYDMTAQDFNAIAAKLGLAEEEIQYELEPDTDPGTAAKKIREKFGDQYALDLNLAMKKALGVEPKAASKCFETDQHRGAIMASTITEPAKWYGSDEGTVDVMTKYVPNFNLLTERSGWSLVGKLRDIIKHKLYERWDFQTFIVMRLSISSTQDVGAMIS
jgi:hypothetical protein